MVWIPYWKGKKVNGQYNKVVFESASAVKSLTSFLIPILRYHKETANLPRYLEHCLAKSIKKILTTSKKDMLTSMQNINFITQFSILSWDTAKTLHNCYFQYFRHAWLHPSKMIDLLICTRKLLHLSFFS